MTTTQLNHDPARYQDDGYCVFRGVLDPATIAAARRELDALMALSPDTRPEHLVEPHVRHAAWLGLCLHPRVIDCVRAVLGDELMLIMSHLIVKPPFDGRRVAWHQDRPTWPTVDGDDVATAWLALDDADAGNGCMRVIPRSHDRARAIDHSPAPDAVFDLAVGVGADEERRAVDLCLRAGDLSIHDGRLIHGSEANLSPRRRGGYTMRYADPRTVRVDPAKHWVPVYRVSGAMA